MRAVAGVDQMRVAIDQPRRDPAARAIDHLCRIECGGIGAAARIDDPTIPAGDRRRPPPRPHPSSAPAAHFAKGDRS